VEAINLEIYEHFCAKISVKLLYKEMVQQLVGNNIG
jgi:hypothetical protein